MGRPCWRIFPTFTWAKEIYMFSTFANLIFPLSPVISFVLGRQCWQGDGEPRGRSCVCRRCVLGFSVSVPAEHQVLLQGIWNSSPLQGHCSHHLWALAVTVTLCSDYCVFHLTLSSALPSCRLDCSDFFFYFTSKRGCSLRSGQCWEWTHGDVW